MGDAAPFPAPFTGRDQEEGDAFAPRFDASGLVTAIVTHATSGALLMVAHMNAEALRLSIETGDAWFWSRSRSKLWRKGESSGALQKIVEMRTDCDQDAIWLKVIPQKAEDTCHTGRETCFYRRIEAKGGSVRLVKDQPA
jgi:phosphoribosyl-AMP cyclohydrolase